jgi:hypothetical protein
MICRKSLPVLFLVIASALALMSGCGGKIIDRQGLDASGRVAVVSVVMPCVADVSRDANRAVLQASVNRALERVQTGLASVHSWSVLDPVKEKKGKTVQAFGSVSDGDLAALFPAQEDRKRTAELVQQERSRWKEGFIGAEGLPIVPRSAFAGGDEVPQTDAAVQQVMLQQAGKLCSALNVDAVVFVHLRASITHPREAAFIVTDNRTDGMLRMAATMVVVDRTGRIIVDMAWPQLDEASRTRDLLPLYRGAGKDALKDENIDLNDPRKKIPQAFTTLTDEAVADLLAGLKSAVGK